MVEGKPGNLLIRKLFRELWHHRAQMAAVAAVVACGIAVFVSMSSVRYSLEATRADYYSRYRFADVFMQVKRAPEYYRKTVERIPGVASVSTRIIADVTLDVPGLEEPATGRLISLPDYGDGPILNDLYIKSGRALQPGADDEVIASQPFLEANGLRPGDRLKAVINGHMKELRIVGMGLSPEYVYEVQPGAFFPDNEHFGVFWMGRRALESALDMSGAFNDLSLTLSHNGGEADVKGELDRLFKRYGSLGAYGRSDQLSNRFLSDEIKQVGIQITFLPSIFLAVGIFLINIVLARIVAVQRPEIAVLKAMGFSNRAVAIHYLFFALTPAVMGSIIGSVLGAWLGKGLMGIYADFYNFAHPLYYFRFQEVVISVILCVSSAMLGAFGAVRRVVQLPPAEAMRSEVPKMYRPGIFDRTELQKHIPVSLRIIVRNLERRPWKAALSVVMIASAVAILIAGRYSYDAVERMTEVEFTEKHREDLTLLFNDSMPVSVASTVGSYKGVLEHEYYRDEPVTLHYRHRSRRQTVRGLASEGGLQRLIDSHELPAEGLLMTTELARLLNVVRGDTVEVEFLLGSQNRRSVVVAGMLDEILGLSAYMDIKGLHRLAGDGGAVNGAFLRIDTSRARALYSEFKSMPGVGGVMMLKALKKSFDDLIAESMLTSTLILTIFACVLAFAVIYNGARISLSERARELSSLRVLGLTKREISVILLGEQAVLTLLAIPPGFLAGIGLSVLLALSLSSELYRLPLVFSSYNFLFSFIVVVSVSLVSGFAIRRRLIRLDLIEVLKTRE
ncbi:MAG: ABC transporter permease [Chlorobium phaeovibrioides]|nr:ABC transporter permease [Chlorobium phaeovibrioides]